MEEIWKMTPDFNIKQILLQRISAIQGVLGKGKYYPSTKELYVPCPFCSPKDRPKKKFSINIVSLKYHCWICGVSGNRIDLQLRKITGWSFKNEFSLEYIELNKICSALPNLRFDNQDNEKTNKINLSLSLSDKLKQSSSPLVRTAKDINAQVDFILKHAVPAQSNIDAIAYLKSRGLSEFHAIRQPILFIEIEGESYLVFPSCKTRGHDSLNGLVLRNLSSDPTKKKHRIIKTPGEDEGFFYQSQCEFELPIVLCEGIFDAIKLYFNAVPLLGKNKFPKALISELKKLKRQPPVVILLDNDAYREAYMLQSKLKSSGVHFPIVVLLPPEIKDPGESSTHALWSIIIQKLVASLEKRGETLIDDVHQILPKQIVL